MNELGLLSAKKRLFYLYRDQTKWKVLRQVKQSKTPPKDSSLLCRENIKLEYYYSFNCLSSTIDAVSLSLDFMSPEKARTHQQYQRNIHVEIRACTLFAYDAGLMTEAIVSGKTKLMNNDSVHLCFWIFKPFSRDRADLVVYEIWSQVVSCSSKNGCLIWKKKKKKMVCQCQKKLLYVVSILYGTKTDTIIYGVYIVITGYLNEIDTNNILNEMDREIDGFFF